MADADPIQDGNADRLEAALARIARGRPGNEAAKARLDSLINEMRLVLGQDQAD